MRLIGGMLVADDGTEYESGLDDVYFEPDEKMSLRHRVEFAEYMLKRWSDWHRFVLMPVRSAQADTKGTG